MRGERSLGAKPAVVVGLMSPETSFFEVSRVHAEPECRQHGCEKRSNNDKLLKLHRFEVPDLERALAWEKEDDPMFGYGTSLAMVTANWVLIVLAVAMIAGLLARVPREEQMMIEVFGEEYRAYMQRIGRFSPRV